MPRTRHEPKALDELWSPMLAKRMQDFAAFDRACSKLTEAATHIREGAALLQLARLDASDIVDDEARRLFLRAAGQMKAAIDAEFFGPDEQQ